MKTIAYLFKLFFICLSFLMVSCSPNTRFSLLDGSTHSESDFKGQWLIVNFWAEWCAPCLEEVPELNKLHHLSTELNVNILGVSYDQLSNNELISIVNKWDIQYPVMASEPIPILSFGLPQALPTNYIISPDGELLRVLTGKQTLSSLQSELARLKNDYIK